MNKFEKRHKSSLELIETINITKKDTKQSDASTDLLKEIKEKIEELDGTKKKMDLEVKKIKTRITMVEAKQPQAQLPDINCIPYLLKFFNLDENCTKNDVNHIINLRIMELSPESTVSNEIFATCEMTTEKREQCLMFYNNASQKLLKWIKQRNLSQKELIIL